MTNHTYLQDRPIGVFDSGIGGLTVAAALRRALPAEDIIYLGDTARVPYGNKSPRTILKFALEAILYLARHSVKLIVIACNTVSSVALPRLQEIIALPLIGVIEPGVNEALKLSRNRRIGVIGTLSTIRSETYQNLLRQSDSGIHIEAIPCPLFVPLAEEGLTEGNIPLLIAEHYLKSLRENHIDILILGCTHYPLLKGVIQEAVGSEVTVVDSSEAVAHRVHSYLIEEGLMKSFGKGSFTLLLTDLPLHYQSLIHRFFGEEVPEVAAVKIEDA
ncbi:MAG: glutamate racemase [bacterium]